MSRVHQRDTKPEIVTRRFLHAHGYRFRLHAKELPGTPDIILPRLKTVIFINGCFWHRHPHCRKATLPESNRCFWETKIMKNVQRDRAARTLLRRLKWSVVTIWECQLKNRGTQTACLSKLLKRLETT
jgi:DNA mismatch endonuclease, patch repair protein